MAELGQNEVSGVFGGVSFDGQVNNEAENVQVNAGTIRTNNLPASRILAKIQSILASRYRLE